MDVDVVPVGERGLDCRPARGVGAGKVLERLIGEHDAPAEGVVGAVALVDGDLVARILQLHQDREVEPGRAGADDPDAQRRTVGGQESRSRGYW